MRTVVSTKGQIMPKRYHTGEEFYASMDSRRALEKKDSGMISEDHSAMANMPQNVIMRQYAQTDYAMYPKLDDTITGIDYQIDKDARGKTIKRGENPEKY